MGVLEIAAWPQTNWQVRHNPIFLPARPVMHVGLVLQDIRR